jgi:hypothetical protein
MVAGVVSAPRTTTTQRHCAQTKRRIDRARSDDFPSTQIRPTRFVSGLGDELIGSRVGDVD